METCQLASPEEIEFEINNICRELQSAGRKAKKLLIDKEKQIMHGVRRRQDSGMDSMEHKEEQGLIKLHPWQVHLGTQGNS